jgi:DNA excision repair protein ERCC-2
MSAPEPQLAPGDERKPEAEPYTVAVRVLCEFAAKQGDLDLRFTPAPTAEEGMAGHRLVQSQRSASYRAEVPVHGRYRDLRVRGRADGFDAEQALLEEIKTCTGDAGRIPENRRRLHWAQAKVYGALLCRRFDLPAVTVSLVYFDIVQRRELPPLSERHTAQALYAFFETLCERFLAWARAEAAHRRLRDRSLRRLGFPYPSFRGGQREFAQAVYEAARGQACLLAQAPTGIGKTLAALFPMLKACPQEAIDKVFFLTAKNPGKALALAALAALQRRNPALRLRALELTAREQCCEHPDKTCHGESCPLARGFYDRLPGARAEAAQQPVLDRERLRGIALGHAVCPYFLAQEMARWCDLIVADYNHYFDRSGLLHALAQENGWRVGVLVDEAHNLLERARAMYTASLGSERLRALADAPPRVAAPLARLRGEWRRVARAARDSYTVLAAVPAALAAALRETTAALAEHFAAAPVAAHGELQAFYFDALALERAVDDPGPHALLDLRLHAPSRPDRARIESTLTLRNVVPARFLAPRFASAHCVVLFSATLAPWQFHIDMLGLPETTRCIDVPSPFLPAQLSVRIVDAVSTRYRDRAVSIAPIVRLIGETYARAPGNHLLFASSFEYLDRIADRLAAAHPDIPCWRQTPQMSDAERAGFLRRFVPDGRGIGCAVLGGAFAEGIDLIGTRLVGVFIATLGLPQVNAVNEEMRRRLDALFGAGYDYAYLYPGLRKVVQAAGRVIRTETDRGSVYLIDDRYARADVRRLLPAWWRIDTGRAAEGADPRNGRARIEDAPDRSPA